MTSTCSICNGPFPAGRRATAPDGRPAHAICLGRDHGRDHGRRSDIPRAMTTERRHLTRELLASQAALLDDEDYAALDERPRTWGECADKTGPCPWVSCRHHLAIDVNPYTGSIKLNHPDIEPEDLEEPCALRIAAGGPLHLEQVGRALNITRERTRQLEQIGLRQLRRKAERL